MAEKQVRQAQKGVVAKLPADKKKQYDELEKKLAAVQPGRPEAPIAQAVTDVGPKAPPTHRLLGGDWHKPREELEPGFPKFLGGGTVDTKLLPDVVGTGRRSALARWLTRKDNPLTARVVVNRMWQHHFGVGIVASSADFGAQGDAPTHPELLDWLAVELVEHGWSLKQMHRLMVLSSAYCQDSTLDPSDEKHVRAQQVDPDNHLLWHARRRRLEGESIRDHLLALSGDLNLRMYGPSARPTLPEKLSNYAWKPDEKPEDRNRRSVYVLAKRNLRYPLFDAFDQPDLHNSCSRRVNTTTAPQALLLFNGDFPLEQSRKLADTLLAKHGERNEELVRDAYRRVWGRQPDADEVKLGVKFLKSQSDLLATRPEQAGKRTPRERAVADFCHALLNTNEFLYVD
jgi:hypothetical protein